MAWLSLAEVIRRWEEQADGSTPEQARDVWAAEVTACTDQRHTAATAASWRPHPLEMTMNIYGHVTLDDKLTAMDRLGDPSKDDAESEEEPDTGDDTDPPKAGSV